MGARDLGHPDGARAEGDASAKQEFLRKFASLSVAAVLLGVSTGCCPIVVYGPDPVEVYGPPQVTTSTPDPGIVVLYGPPPTATSTPDPEPSAVYGPPPDGQP
jgi:hypothetical protein